LVECARGLVAEDVWRYQPPPVGMPRAHVSQIMAYGAQKAAVQERGVVREAGRWVRCLCRR